MTWAVLVVILSALDAAFTLLHIQRGGDEIVPTMRWAIEQGPSTFIHLKMALTGAGAILLAMHEHFGSLRCDPVPHQGGGAAFSKADRARFLQALDKALST